MRILFVTSNRLGDAVLSTGLLDHLVHAHPDARITVACGPVAEGVFTRMPCLERIIVVEKRPFGRHWLPLWAAVAGTRWDLVVDIRGSALSFLVCARRRGVMRPSGGHKTVQLARVLGLHPAPLPTAWFAPEDSIDAVPSGQTFVVLAPTANWAPKVWPADRFVSLFRALGLDALPVVIAGPGETEAAMAQPVLDALPGALPLIGKLTLPQITALLSRASLFVGNDSGLMHLAAAAGAPTLGLFGPTNAAEYAPSGRCARALVSPDGTMAGLTVEAALEAARGLLAVRRGT